jgi:myo-inositol-1(or 4)-monophosphatase
MDYQKLNQDLQDIAKEAGAYMLGSTERESTEKSGAKDFVTVADIKSQNIIAELLAKKYPDIQVLSEEDPEEARKKLYEPDFTGFVLDPIDGTYNFKRDMRESAVSIGYVEAEEIKTGVVYDPYRQEVFSAVTGRGAVRNGQSIKVSDQTDLHGSSVATSNGYDDAAAARNLRRQLGIYEQEGIMPWTSCPGSGVLALVWLACGRIDALHHNGFKPWDNAAAFLIIREAGGKVLTLDSGKEASFTSACVLAGTPVIVEKLQGIFANLPPELLS